MSDPFPSPGQNPPPPPEQPPPPGQPPYGQYPPPASPPAHGQPPSGQPQYGQPQYGYQQQGYGYSYGSNYQYSGFWRRVAAAVIDGVLLSVPTGIISAIAGASQFNAGVTYGYSPGTDALIQLVNTVIGIVYYAGLEGTRGQTVGKMAMGVKVIDADTGGFIGVPRAIGRYFARILSALALGLGYLWMLWDGRKQCWHDKLVRSVVVRTQ